MNKQIQENKKVHDKIANKYESRHPEIFNDIEQGRLHEQLEWSVKQIKTKSSRKTALDFGCGSGNLTKHLMELDLGVVSADVSPKFLKLIEDRFIEIDKNRTLLLNGEDLDNISDDKFDLVATYSVLHHVPDYLKIIEEFVRVVKPGGVIYLDHEVNENYWKPPQKLEDYYNKMPDKSASFLRFFNPCAYIRKFRMMLNPKYQEEGDIHVWPDDHIEWDKIKAVLKEKNCEIIRENDYLLYNSEQSESVWNEYKDQTSDMRCLIVRKKQ